MTSRKMVERQVMPMGSGSVTSKTITAINIPILLMALRKADPLPE